MESDCVAAQIKFKILCDNTNGVYVGVTPTHLQASYKGYAACGRADTLVYRCRDGDKRLNGRWSSFNTKPPGRKGGKGRYRKGEQITITFYRNWRSLIVEDLEGMVGRMAFDMSFPPDCSFNFFVDTCLSSQSVSIVSSRWIRKS
eukprot:CAMPEP_0115753272 /NCGR_PEP_ID=MMETSP0272-20121206/96232_1 /TAXON_ID=71861 /ORGANISM="Scrippsiella trochoidea, Strain CCMP3099" /LENGTH=144 /DNA_ID=CAMNT_0003198569 /DNA_START=98 /DNA_END=532 /DNA_ORIENTATION=+